MTLGMAPLLFGGHIPLAWGLNAALTGSIALILGFGRLLDGNPQGRPSRPAALAFPFWLCASICLWIYLQSVSWTPDSFHHPLWSRAQTALGSPLGGSISINPSETQMALLRLATIGTFAWLGAQFGRKSLWAYRILTAIAVSGALYAAYGLVLRLSNSNTVLWLDKSYLDFANQVTGPFINPNSFAAYLGIALVCVHALFLNAVRHGLADQGLVGLRRWLAGGLNIFNATGLYSILLLPIFASLILSRSRAGFALTVLAIVTLLLCEHLRGRLHERGWGLSRTLVILGVSFGVIIATLSSHGEFLAEKLTATTGSDFSSRLAIAKITLRAIFERPITGFGYGTFADVFPLFRDDSVTMYERYFEAHNAYLEAVLGLGIPAALIFFVGVGYIVYRCFFGALTRGRNHAIPAAASAATVIVGLHAFVDFSIQLEGIAMTYAALLGAGFAQSWSSRRPQEWAGPALAVARPYAARPRTLLRQRCLEA